MNRIFFISFVIYTLTLMCDSQLYERLAQKYTPEQLEKMRRQLRDLQQTEDTTAAATTPRQTTEITTTAEATTAPITTPAETTSAATTEVTTEAATTAGETTAEETTAPPEETTEAVAAPQISYYFGDCKDLEKNFAYCIAVGNCFYDYDEEECVTLFNMNYYFPNQYVPSQINPFSRLPMFVPPVAPAPASAPAPDTTEAAADTTAKVTAQDTTAAAAAADTTEPSAPEPAPVPPTLPLIVPGMVPPGMVNAGPVIMPASDNPMASPYIIWLPPSGGIQPAPPVQPAPPMFNPMNPFASPFMQPSFEECSDLRYDTCRGVDEDGQPCAWNLDEQKCGSLEKQGIFQSRMAAQAARLSKSHRSQRKEVGVIDQDAPTKDPYFYIFIVTFFVFVTLTCYYILTEFSGTEELKDNLENRLEYYYTSHHSQFTHE